MGVLLTRFLPESLELSVRDAQTYREARCAKFIHNEHGCCAFSLGIPHEHTQLWTWFGDSCCSSS